MAAGPEVRVSIGRGSWAVAGRGQLGEGVDPRLGRRQLLVQRCPLGLRGGNPKQSLEGPHLALEAGPFHAAFLELLIRGDGSEIAAAQPPAEGCDVAHGAADRAVRSSQAGGEGIDQALVLLWRSVVTQDPLHQAPVVGIQLLWPSQGPFRF